MEGKTKKEILIYILVAVISLSIIISLVYTIYLPVVFKTSRIFLLLFGITFIPISMLILVTRLLITEKKQKQYLFYASMASIIIAIIFLLAFAVPFAKSKRINSFVQNKKGLSIENNNFHKKYGYYIYADKRIINLPSPDSLIIDKSQSSKKIRIIEKIEDIPTLKGKVKQDITTITFLTYERYDNENQYIIKDGKLKIIEKQMPKIPTIHKILLPSVFNRHKEEKEIVIFIPPNLKVTII